MSHDIFISYSSRDEEKASRIRTLLEEAGIPCWMALRDIRVGDDWAAILADAIPASRAVLVVVSASANQSKWVLRELTLADKSHLPLLQIRIQNVTPEGAIGLYLSGTMWLDASLWPIEWYANKIIESVQHVLQKPPKPPVPRLRLWWRVNRRKVSAGVALLAAAAVFVAVPKPCRHDYRVHVSVLDTDGRRVEQAAISSNSTGVVSQTPEGWEIVVPRDLRPAGDSLRINASSVDGARIGAAEVRLASVCEPSVLINLRRAPDSTVRGTVLDSAGKPVAGARVSLRDYPGEAVITGRDGSFQMPAHEPAGSVVVLHIEKEGFPPLDQHHFAGPDPATVTITKSAP